MVSHSLWHCSCCVTLGRNYTQLLKYSFLTPLLMPSNWLTFMCLKLIWKHWCEHLVMDLLFLSHLNICSISICQSLQCYTTNIRLYWPSLNLVSMYFIDLGSIGDQSFCFLDFWAFNSFHKLASQGLPVTWSG